MNRTAQKNDLREIAYEMREMFDLLSPFLEKHTSSICPACENVCCADKHGRYDGDDLLFLDALGIEVPSEETGRKYDDQSCRYMTERGCFLPRWMRPYRCTFFFCDRLLKSIQEGDTKLYRAFIGYFQYLIHLRQRLATEASENGPEA